MTEEATKTGKDLEQRVAQAYRDMGARKVEHDVELEGHQIDVYVELETADRGLQRIAVEAKDYTKPVGIKIVTDFSAVVDHLRREREIDRGVIVSAAGFSRQARKAARKQGIRMLNPADLDAMVTGPLSLRQSSAEPLAVPAERTDIRAAIQKIRRHLDDTWTAFAAQCSRRNELVSVVSDRLRIRETLEYESFFNRYYARLNDEERFQFEQIRAITDGPMYQGNHAILETIRGCPEVMDEIPGLVALRRHLEFWLNKYKRVFTKRPDMCLVYVGVEDAVPFPAGINGALDDWLTTHT